MQFLFTNFFCNEKELWVKWKQLIKTSSTPIRFCFKTETSFSVLPDRSHVSSENGHRQKTHLFKNAVQSENLRKNRLIVCYSWTDKNERKFHHAIHHTLLAQHMLCENCYVSIIVLWFGKRRANCWVSLGRSPSPGPPLVPGAHPLTESTLSPWPALRLTGSTLSPWGESRPACTFLDPIDIRFKQHLIFKNNVKQSMLGLVQAACWLVNLQ